MTSVLINFEGEVSTVDWGTSVSGIRALQQKAVVTMMTKAGSYPICPRGNNMEKSLLSVGAYDLLSIQHALNFAALSTVGDIQAHDTGLPDSLAMDDFSLLLVDLVAGRAQVALSTTSKAGETIVTTTEL